MSFAHNLIYIRQEYGVTQETLAEQLGVSRQTISKWESGINFPETDKLLMLCDLYHTNLDDLMRGNVSISNKKDTELYDRHMNHVSRARTAMIVCILGGIGIFFIADALGLHDNASVALLLAFITVGVLISIVTERNHTDFKRKHLDIKPHYSKETLDHFNRQSTAFIAGGVGCILFGIIFLIALSPAQGNTVNLGFFSFSQDILVGIFMILLACGVGLFTYSGSQKTKYHRFDDTQVSPSGAPSNKETSPALVTHKLKKDHLTGNICGIIMILAVIVFLVGGFLPLTDSLNGGSFGEALQASLSKGQGFALSWIAFPAGGLLCAIASLTVSLFYTSQDELIAEAIEEDPWAFVTPQKEPLTEDPSHH